MKDIRRALMIAKTIGNSIGLGNRDVLDQPHKSEGSPIHNPDKTIRRALMTARSPLHRADGGETDGPAKTTVIGGPVEGDRQLDQSGFYNAAAEAAKAIPQAKGTPQQMMSMVQKVPGTQEAMKWSGADQAFAGQPIVSKDDLVKHFQTNAPKLEETQLGGRQSNMETEYHKYTIPGGENYREVLMRLPYKEHPLKNQLRAVNKKADSIKSDLIHADLTDTPVDPDRRASMEKELVSLRNERLRLNQLFNSAVPLNYTSSHWEEPNVVAHLRMSDRTLPQTNEKALHLEEVQSDWGQDGKRGFKKTDEELAAMKADVLAKHKDYLNLNDEWNSSVKTPEFLSAFQNKIIEPQANYQTAMNKWNEASKATTPEGPYVGNTNKWTDLALKRALIEAARGGHDKLIWTPGEEQALRYKEDDEENDAKRLNGMNKYYGEIVPSRLEKILQSIGHTPEFGTDYIKGKPYDADLDVYKDAVTGKYHMATGDKRDNPDAEDIEAGPFNTHGEAVAHRDLLYKGLKAVPSLKITPAMRETISKGLPRKTGGYVPTARSSAVE